MPFTTVSNIRVSRVSRVRVAVTVTVRVSRVSVMVRVKDSIGVARGCSGCICTPQGG